MAGLKGGSIVTVGNGATVIDRIQTGGPGQVNIPTEKINELGNYKSVATVRDTPDLTFSYESLDVSTEVEALLTGQDGARTVADGGITAAATTLTSATAAFTSDDVGKQVIVAGAGADGVNLVTTIDTVTDASNVELSDAAETTVADASVTIVPNGYDLSLALPIDIASQFKAGKTASSPFSVISSVAVPFLTLEQMSYRFGLRDNASQQGQLRGDTIFYNPGATFVEETAGSGAAEQEVVTAHPAFQSAEGDQRRVLSVTVGGKRLALGADYSESYGTATNGAAITTLTLEKAVATTDKIRIVYSSPDAVSYTQDAHEGSSVKPAAVKGRDIEVYLGGYDPNDVAGSQANRVGGLQSVNVDWRVTLEKDEELGNYYAVAQDFEVPDVNGSLDFKPVDAADLLARLRQMANVSDDKKVIGTATSTPIPLDVVIKNPDTHEVVKRINVSDARFTIPGFTGRVQQKTVLTINFESDEGNLLVYRA